MLSDSEITIYNIENYFYACYNINIEIHEGIGIYENIYDYCRC